MARLIDVHFNVSPHIHIHISNWLKTLRIALRAQIKLGSKNTLPLAKNGLRDAVDVDQIRQGFQIHF